MLLGQDLIRPPLMPGVSFGHGILRQWFGNFVYIDLGKGNWAEGLIAYLADCLYEEQNGRGWEYRKQQLVDYDAYVNSKNEISSVSSRGWLTVPPRPSDTVRAPWFSIC